MKKFGVKLLAQPGFTLVELLLYMGLLSVFLLILSSLFISNLEFQTRSFLNSNLQTATQFMTTRLTYDLEHADSVSIPSSASGTSNQLVLEYGGDSYEYLLTGTSLELTHNGITQPLHPSHVQVTDFTVLRLHDTDEPPMIQFSITTDNTQDTTSQPITIQTTVRKL